MFYDAAVRVYFFDNLVNSLAYTASHTRSEAENLLTDLLGSATRLAVSDITFI